MGSNQHFHEIEHTADKGIRAEGSSLEELFKNMVWGMFHIIFGKINNFPGNKINFIFLPDRKRIKKKETIKTNDYRYNKKYHIDDEERNITLQENAITDLLVSWLSELNFLLLVENFYLSKIENLQIIKKSGLFILKAKLIGNISTDQRSLIKTEIKAVTYHQLKIETSKNGYKGQVIFDV